MGENWKEARKHRCMHGMFGKVKMIPPFNKRCGAQIRVKRKNEYGPLVFLLSS